MGAVNAVYEQAGADGLRGPPADPGPARPARPGSRNEVTAAGLAATLRDLAEHGPAEVERTLAACEDDEMAAAGLPPGTWFAHKPGWFEGVCHDAGIVRPDDGRTVRPGGAHRVRAGRRRAPGGWSRTPPGRCWEAAAVSRVVAVRTRVVSLPLHTTFTTALRSTDTIDSVLVEVEDADGVVGHGEAAVVPAVTGEDRSRRARATSSGPLRDAVVGADAGYLGDVLAAVGPHAPPGRGARAGLDIALHDLAARRAGVPLAVLLGARRARRRPPT